MTFLAVHTTVSDPFVNSPLAQNKVSNFYYSFLFLPKPKREAIETIYAFCRQSDDIVDGGRSVREKRQHLRQWADELEKSLYGVSRIPILNKLSAVIKRFNIPLHHFYDLLKGMEMDLRKRRYKTWSELEQYCYRAASTVGLISAEVFGYKHPDTRQYAINLGIALQLTNILRDIRADAKKGRIYLPEEDLKRFGYTEEELMRAVYNERFVALMKFEADRARSYFLKAKSFLHEEDKPFMYAARTMGLIYFQLLRRIEAVNYDVFSNRIRIPSVLKMLVAVAFRIRQHVPTPLVRSLTRQLPI
ncbi:MAG TPA: presqualene diphosphate synthase HpnD [Bacteroidota bacterium]|nr:presqualene diphosphate synthase HpnD [Bacteroidota bacterium]